MPAQLVHEPDLNSRLGKPSFWFPVQLVGKIHYQDGIPEFDEYRSNMWDSTLLFVNLKMRPEGLELSTLYKMKMRKYGIPFADIQRINLERETLGDSFLTIDLLQNGQAAQIVGRVPRKDYAGVNNFMKRRLSRFMLR
ncbi:hypothetical protein GCM10027048_22580 [Hymenobacter coalescens]